MECLENGELSLEESLGAFERGIRLTRECQTPLSQAKQKVQILLERNGELSEVPFDAEDDEVRSRPTRRAARHASTPP